MAVHTVATALSGAKFAKAVKAAHSANSGARTATGRVGMTDKVNIHALDGIGSVVRRRRWHMAAMLSWVVFGLPFGSQWVPCYMCGNIFHAWTMDGEHVDPVRGSIVGNLILACHSCNHAKSNSAIPPAAIRDKLLILAHGWQYPQGPRKADPLYREFKRRPDGSGMASWEFGTVEPTGLRYVA